MASKKNGKVDTKVECSGCGVEYDCIEVLKEIIREGVKIHESESYCFQCTKNIDTKRRKEEEQQKIDELDDEIIRLENEVPHEKHEYIISELINMLENPEYRQGEYINDTLVLAHSLLIISKVEMEKAAIQMRGQVAKRGLEEEWRFAEIAGMIESSKRELNGWVERSSIASEMLKDVCIEKDVLFPILPWKEFNG